jgi:hypothetical protein
MVAGFSVRHRGIVLLYEDEDLKKRFSFLVSRFWFALVTLPAFGEMRAGAALRVVTPELAKGPAFMAGFDNNRRATAIHDDLFARCLALQPGDTPLVICGVDSIGLFWDDVVWIRQTVKTKLGRNVDVVVAALHDHQAPDTMGLWGPNAGTSGINEDYNSLVIERTAEAALAAIANLRPASIALAKTHPPELDTFIHDNRPPDVHDAELILAAVTGADGKPIATLINWSNHPETLGSRNTQITADYPAAIYKRLEERRGGVAVFVNGAVGGMQSPLGAKIAGIADNSFEKAERIGQRVADIGADALEHASPVKITRYEFAERLVRIPIANKGFEQAAQANIYHGRKPSVEGQANAPVGLIRLLDGDSPMLEIALVPGELYPELSVGGIQKYEGADFPDAPEEPAIKSMMTAPYRMLFGLADDEIGYIIPKAEWDNEAPWLQNARKRFYGEVNSVGPEAAPIIAAALKELLQSK